MTTTTSQQSRLQAPRLAGTTRDDSRWARAAAVAGLAFVVLEVVGTFAPGTPPASDASTGKIATYFASHGGAIKAQLLLGGLGIAALFWWFGALWRVISRAESDRPRLAVVAAVSLGAGLALALMNGVINATVAIRTVNADTTRLFYSFSLVVIAAGGFGIGTFLLATSVVTSRTGVVPRWLSALGWIAGLGFLAGTFATVTDSNAVNQIGLVAFLVWCVWIASISVLMWRGRDFFAG
jgi:hypothetical protein